MSSPIKQEPCRLCPRCERENVVKNGRDRLKSFFAGWDTIVQLSRIVFMPLQSLQHARKYSYAPGAAMAEGGVIETV